MEPAAATFRALLTAWVDLVRRRAALVLALSLALAAASGWYAATHTAIDTNTSDMLSPDLPFQRDADHMSKAFPQLEDLIVVVVDGATADQADAAATRLAAALRGRTDVVRSVFYAEGDPFFRRNGLLYLEPDELTNLTDRLAGAQAFLGKLWHDPSLRGLFDVLGLALDNIDRAKPPAEFATVIDAIARATEDAVAGRPGVLSWSELLASKPAGRDERRRLVLVQPKFDYASLQPAGKAIDAIRKTATSLGLTAANGVTVRLTGSPPLAEEELDTVLQGMGFATALSMALVLGLLFWGLKSTRMALGNLVTLVIGLAWTGGFAALAVGRLNLLSIAFAVLFIGLSVDFGIHFALRVREAMDRGDALAPAMRWAVETAGGPITLCAVAAAISFYSFLPTDYLGLAELGLIAGTSMFIALFANFTVLPATMALMPPRVGDIMPASAQRGPQQSVGSFIIGHARAVALGAVVLALAAAALLPHARFDFDPLNLKDPKSESVATLHDLMKGGQSGEYGIDILAPDPAAARLLAQRLEKLPEVKGVTTPDDYVPKDQEAKLAAIDQAALFLLPAFQGEPMTPPTAAERRAALEKFRAVLVRHTAAGTPVTPLIGATRRLDAALAKLPATSEALAALERRLLSALPSRLRDLRESLQAGPVKAGDLPAALRARMVAADGRVRIEVEPRVDVHDRAALERFVAAVRSVAPDATGSPVIIIEAGNTIVRAFVEAGAISVVAIAVLIAILLRRAGEVALVFAPLVMSALLTAAAAALLGMPFNFANVIVLPLLFGLGVASGINLVMRARLLAPKLDGLFASTTPRAVVFSALTTIASFGTMGFSGHPGTASMGILLAVALTLSLTTSLVLLPALIAIFGVRRAAHAE